MKLYDVGTELLPTVAYGDALGLPFETKSSTNVGSITELGSIQSNTYLDVPPHLRGNKGIWSDDTHLSLATTMSLIRRGGFNITDIAQAHIEAYLHVQGDTDDSDLVPAIVTKGHKNGYGGSTVRSIGRLSVGVEPRYSGEQGGSGNGVLMKLAPLVYWQFVSGINKKVAEEQTISYTIMTHDSPVAVVSSLVHRAILSDLLTMDPRDDISQLDTLYANAITYAEKYEAALGVSADTSEVLKRLVVTGKHINREGILSAAEKGGFYVPETLLMAYGSFLLEPSFPNTAYRTAELGGDSDSTASIASTMATFYWGKQEKPHDMHEVFAIERLERISKQLAEFSLQQV
jgi:ADP-ribosylglycohydrolase